MTPGEFERLGGPSIERSESTSSTEAHMDRELYRRLSARGAPFPSMPFSPQEARHDSVSSMEANADPEGFLSMAGVGPRGAVSCQGSSSSMEVRAAPEAPRRRPCLAVREILMQEPQETRPGSASSMEANADAEVFRRRRSAGERGENERLCSSMKAQGNVSRQDSSSSMEAHADPGMLQND